MHTHQVHPEGEFGCRGAELNVENLQKLCRFWSVFPIGFRGGVRGVVGMQGGSSGGRLRSDSLERHGRVAHLNTFYELCTSGGRGGGWWGGEISAWQTVPYSQERSV